MKPMPATMTKRTTKSLIATSTMLTRIDSLMPMLTMTVSTIARRNAMRSKLDPELPHQHPEVRRPALRDDGRPQQQLEQEVPPDDPRDELTEGGVREREG